MYSTNYLYFLSKALVVIYLFIYLFIYTLFKVNLHITLQQEPVNVNYQN